MARFRKKPVMIEATQLTREVVEAFLWDGGALPDGCRLGSASHHPENRRLHKFHATVDTLEGPLRAEIGDWIIRGVAGEFYPCKPDIFEATYEPVPEQPTEGRPAPEEENQK